MKVVIEGIGIMNSNTKQDPSNLNSNLNHGGPGSVGSGGKQGPAAAAPGVELSNMEYLKNLADVMAQQGDGSKNNSSSSGNNINNNGGGANVYQFEGVPSGGNTDQFTQMRSSETDTCASSAYNAGARRVSRSSLVSHGSLSDMLNADQVASNNLAMMNMLANQQGGQMGNNNFNSGGNSQQHQALNQSMSQLMMNGAMNGMSSNMLSSGLSNSWNAGTGSSGNGSNPMTVTDPSLLGAYGIDNGAGQPLLIPPKKTKNKHKQTFAQKLMHILSIKECQSAIRWMPNGCAFCIVDSKELVDKVLPKYFKEAKYTSFTRKLNRWGFKHFTLPTNEPSTEKEMSIYTHEKFLRDNPALCQQMDGGHRRRNSAKEGGDSGLGSSMTSQGSTTLQDNVNQLQQQTMMMQQMQQMQQQQNMMMQQMQQQLGGAGTGGGNNTGMGNTQGGNSAPMFDISALTAGGNNSNFNSMMGGNSNFGNNNSNLMGNNNMGSFMDSSNASTASSAGMRRTSLGFMPYMPASNRRDSGFSIGGLSAVSNDLGGSFTGGANVAGGMGGLSGIGASAQSLEKFRKMSPGPSGEQTGNATFDTFKAGMMGGGEGKTAEGGEANQQDIRHSQAKLAVLEDMIAKERRKQSLLSSLDPDPATM